MPAQRGDASSPRERLSKHSCAVVLRRKLSMRGHRRDSQPCCKLTGPRAKRIPYAATGWRAGREDPQSSAALWELLWVHYGFRSVDGLTEICRGELGAVLPFDRFRGDHSTHFIRLFDLHAARLCAGPNSGDPKNLCSSTRSPEICERVADGSVTETSETLTPQSLLHECYRSSPHVEEARAFS